MKKKTKLDLTTLRVQSFVTSLERSKEAEHKGGVEVTGNNCDSIVPTDCCTGYYPSINAPCPTIHRPCPSVNECVYSVPAVQCDVYSLDACPTMPVRDCI